MTKIQLDFRFVTLFSTRSAWALAFALSLSAGCKSTTPTEKSVESAKMASAKGASASPPSSIVNLSASKFQSLYKEKGGTLLDVRTPEEIADGRIAGASVINAHDPKFDSKASSIQKDKPIFVYCRSGGRSGRAVKRLSKLGFTEIYNLDGGINAWRGAKLPVESSPQAETKNKADAMSGKDFDALLKEHPVALIDFHTEWCTPCIEMAPIVDKLEKSFEGKALVKRIDIDKSEALAKRENIRGVPVFILYEKGKESWRHSGALSEGTLKEKLAEATKD